MAYEYEDEVKSVISTETVFSHEETEKEARVKELQEVYRKAKAWDNYLLSVIEDARNEFGDNDDLIKHAVELNKKIFMEDE